VERIFPRRAVSSRPVWTLDAWRLRNETATVRTAIPVVAILVVAIALALALGFAAGFGFFDGH
jgi:hypothetical protein